MVANSLRPNGQRAVVVGGGGAARAADAPAIADLALSCRKPNMEWTQ